MQRPDLGTIPSCLSDYLLDIQSRVWSQIRDAMNHVDSMPECWSQQVCRLSVQVPGLRLADPGFRCAWGLEDCTGFKNASSVGLKVKRSYKVFIPESLSQNPLKTSSPAVWWSIWGACQTSQGRASLCASLTLNLFLTLSYILLFCLHHVCPWDFVTTLLENKCCHNTIISVGSSLTSSIPQLLILISIPQQKPVCYWTN